VKRAVESLSEDLSFLTSRARAGGAWIPPKLEGELKLAVEALNKARNTVMLPKMNVDTLSVGDVKQLTAEAERVYQLQEELRELREKLKSARDEQHLYMERCSRAEEDLEASEETCKSMRMQLEREREKVELHKRRAEVLAATESAKVAECVLKNEDSKVDSDIAEVTAPLISENDHLRSVLSDPKWIEEMDLLREELACIRAERDAALQEAKTLAERN